MLYLIAYDLNMEGQNYRAVTQAIASVADSEDDCCCIQRSVWIVRSNTESADTLLNRLKSAMDDNDQCFITRVGYYPAWNMKPEIESQIRRMMRRDNTSNGMPRIF